MADHVDLVRPHVHVHRLLRRRRQIGRGDLEPVAEADRAPPHRAAQDVDRPQEARDERGPRVLVHLARRPDLLHPSAVHQHDAVGDRQRFLLIVGDEEARHADLLVQSPKPVPEPGAHPGVERPERLVEQEHPRTGGQGARQRDALALAAGELGRQPALQPLELDEPEELVDPRPHLGLRAAADHQPEGDVLRDRHVAEEGVVLEDEADVPIPRRRVRRALPGEQDLAAVRPFDARDDAEDGALAAPRGAQERDELAFPHLEAHVLDGGEGAEAPGQAPGDDAHGRSQTRRARHSTSAFAASVSTAIEASTEATANAPGTSYSWRSFSARSGSVSVLPAMWPETT